MHEKLGSRKSAVDCGLLLSEGLAALPSTHAFINFLLSILFERITGLLKQILDDQVVHAIVNKYTDRSVEVNHILNVSQEVVEELSDNSLALLRRLYTFQILFHEHVAVVEDVLGKVRDLEELLDELGLISIFTSARR